jgi:putative endonuclease
MIASKSRMIYIGMTNDLSRRVFGPKNKLVEGFTKHYCCPRLVSFDDVIKAIDREKQLKRWSRVKKVWLIERRHVQKKKEKADVFSGR